jgi:3-phenylpropionate/trans-cinnamate dioxygenase ferredoxin reductase component
MTALEHVVVVGLGAAGIAAAEALRAEGYGGRLTLVGAETHLPYDRPPLSKQVLTRAWDPAQTALRADADYSDLDAGFLLGTAATGLDVSARKLLLGPGPALDYDALVIATGVRPRRLASGHELDGVHVLRTLDDAVALRDALTPGRRVAVIGAGFLGTETAAAARGLGLEVTLIDPLPTPLHRQLGARVGALAGRLHAERGVDVCTGVAVDRLFGRDGRVAGVALGDGRLVGADVVVVAIGSVPATDWLADSGLTLDDGVSCDSCCRAAPGVYAGGDVASGPDPRFGRRLRLEHRMNATEHAAAAARNLLGAETPYTPVPYFWTDQYDSILQVYGILPADAQVARASGDPAQGGFVALYGSGGRVVGALGWNSPRPLRAARRHVVEGTAWDELDGLSEFPG